jgi:transposase
VVIIIDNALWHQGPIIEEAMAAHPHLKFYRLPSYSPQLNPIEQFWRILRRRATHNRLFTTRSELRQTLRHNLCYCQSIRHKVLSLLESKRKKAEK